MEVVWVAFFGLLSSTVIATAGILGPIQERKAARRVAQNDLRFERAVEFIRLVRENRYDPTRENERAMANAHMAFVSVLRSRDEEFANSLAMSIKDIKDTPLGPEAKPVDAFGLRVFSYLRATP